VFLHISGLRVGTGAKSTVGMDDHGSMMQTLNVYYIRIS